MRHLATFAQLAMLVAVATWPAASAADDHTGELEYERTATLTGPEGSVDADFGAEVAIRGYTVAVAAPGHDSAATDAGIVYLYELTSTDEWQRIRTIEAPDPEVGARFGDELELSNDFLIVGAPNLAVDGETNVGAAYVFQRDVGRDGHPNWGQVARFSPELADQDTDFGRSVAVYEHPANDTVTVAVSSADGVHIYNQGVGASWPRVTTLSPEEPSPPYGVDVALEDGVLAGLRAGGADDGGVFTVVEGDSDENPWSRVVDIDFAPDASGQLGQGGFDATTRVALAGASAEEVDGVSGAGSVYAFGTESDPTARWAQFQRLTSPSPSEDGRFGQGVAVSFGQAVVAEPGRDSVAEDAGGLSVYARHSDRVGLWEHSGDISPDDLEADAEFGRSLDGGFRIAVGSIGAVYVYELRHVPILRDDVATTDRRTSIEIDVLANDVSADGRPLSINWVGHPERGTLEIHDRMTLYYEPDRRFLGTISVDYSVHYGSGSVRATVDIEVVDDNTPPVAVDDLVEAPYGSSLELDPTRNDYDTDGDEDTFRVELLEPIPANTSLLEDRKIRLDEVTLEETRIPYRLFDGYGGSDAAEVIISATGQPEWDRPERDDEFRGNDIGSPCLCSSLEEPARGDSGRIWLAVWALLGLAALRRHVGPRASGHS